MSTVGETDFEPVATGVTAPMPWFNANVVAFVVVHESAEAPPASMEEGLPESVQVGAGGGGGSVVTDTLAGHVTEPPAPVAVSVYAVVERGDTEFEPAPTGVTAPIPWSIETLVAFAVVHERSELPPFIIDVGDAENVQVGAGGGGGGNVVTTIPAEQVILPPGPVAVST